MSTKPQFLSNEQKGSLYAITSGLCYGLLGYFGVTIIEADFSITNMLFWRFLVSAIFMACLLLFRLSDLKNNLKDMIKVILAGAILYCPTSIIFFISSKYIGTGLSMVIFFTYPAVVILLNYLLYKTNISKIYYAAIGLITVGMVLLVDISEFTFDLFGIVLGIISATFYAAYILVSKKNQLTPLTSTLMVSIGCTLTCLIGSIATDSLQVPATFDLWFNILSLGIICTALPILLLLQGLKYINSEKASILSVLEPVFVVIFGMLLLDETITLIQAIGIIILLSGAIITLLSDQLSQIDLQTLWTRLFQKKSGSKIN
jgi:drug/metabolite transporter (DMT)-like permease